MALERVDFVKLESPTPLREVLARVQAGTDMAVQEKLRPFIVMSRAQLETRYARVVFHRGFFMRVVRRCCNGIRGV
ncbi:hypothetical protein JB92DRAFT_3021712 [Gautieria morchelliformis]|nr:hypothetical protein JB92DRAFT_3021712 [Gautieria morchelliformis]